MAAKKTVKKVAKKKAVKKEMAKIKKRLAKFKRGSYMLRKKNGGGGVDGPRVPIGGLSL